jgi:Arc/MetJ-type ribon-helix-helix transcriptional regulator
LIRAESELIPMEAARASQLKAVGASLLALLAVAALLALMNLQEPSVWVETVKTGYYLAETGAFSLWWCEATYKVGRTFPRPPPPQTAERVSIEAARNEYEPFQLVITPKTSLKRLRLRLEPFKPAEPTPAGATPIWDEVALVDYVPVRVPTDSWGVVGEYPDPLVPLFRRDRERGEAVAEVEVQIENLQPRRNQPLWITVYVPKGVPKGVYRSSIAVVEAVDANGRPIEPLPAPIPVELRVFGFTLPDDTPLRTAYGVWIDNEWHRLRTPEQFRQVWDLYMQVLRRYRVSPYRPHAYAPIRWEVLGPSLTVDNGVLTLTIDMWQGCAAIVKVRRWNGTREELVEVGRVLPLLEQFEREGVGWEGKGIGWPGAEVVKEVRVVERSEERLVLDVAVERLSSQPANRRFSATVRVAVEAGKPYFAVQLLRIANTDTVRWRVNRYYHLIPPGPRPASLVNAERYGAWLFGDPKNPTTAFGAAGPGFSYSLWVDAAGNPHGDVHRPVGKWLEPNETWVPSGEPALFVFVWDAERWGSLPGFVEGLLGGRVRALPGSVVRVSERAEPEFRYDFSDFDAAMSRYIDEFRFNSFMLDVLPERLGGYERFSPEWTALYKRLMAPILEHLERRGWLKLAYFYWIDEPPPEQYDYVKRGMAALKEAAPGVRRLLTFCYDAAPLPTFYGFVDLWVPVMNLFNEQAARERRALGEEVWWYVCTGPKAPYPNNFIDHPAITHRIRYWMAAKWDLDGDLYWGMTYWRGKNGRLRNPYEDGQSETPEGGYWGNGDGRLLYPPVRQPPPEGAEPVIAPPIPSLRLALIAEGIEDYIYVKLLKQLVERGRAASGSESLQKALQLAEDALGALDRLIRSMADYERDPRKLYAERHKIAEAIEQLAEALGEG